MAGTVKENPFQRMDRLGLEKPHIFWSKLWGEWLTDGGSVIDGMKASRFCIKQDRRWTPRDKS